MRIVAYSEGASEWKSIIEERFPGIRVEIYEDTGRQHDHLNDTEVLIGWRFPLEIFNRLPKLRWIQLISVGVEEYVRAPWIRPGVIITNTRRVYADSVAEYVLWALITLSRKFHQVLGNQSRRRWSQVTGTGLNGKTLGIIGLGSIGKEVAARAKGFGLRVIGIKRGPHEGEFHGVDEVHPPDALQDVLGRSDAIVVCLPLTDETRGILNRSAIKNMKPGAVLINVSRSELVDEDALVQALKDGRLAGAACDVFQQEPLSRWSKLWKVENLIVTPHLSGLTCEYRARIGDLICENIRRFRSQRPLLNVVDRTKGY